MVSRAPTFHIPKPLWAYYGILKPIPPKTPLCRNVAPSPSRRRKSLLVPVTMDPTLTTQQVITFISLCACLCLFSCPCLCLRTCVCSYFLRPCLCLCQCLRLCLFLCLCLCLCFCPCPCLRLCLYTGLCPGLRPSPCLSSYFLCFQSCDQQQSFNTTPLPPLTS
jgi:hypothetical protein